MSKTLIGIIVGIVIIGGGLYLMKDGKKVDQNKTEVPNAPITENKPAGKKMAFSEFIKGAGSYQCTVNQSVNGTDTQGIIYISKGLIRGEYNSKVQNFSITTNFIVKEGYTYTWTSMMPKIGFKTKVDTQNATANTSTATQGSYNFNAEKIGDYNCEAWTLDQSKFALPAGVNFQEVNK